MLTFATVLIIIAAWMNAIVQLIKIRREGAEIIVKDKNVIILWTSSVNVSNRLLI